MGFMDGLGSVLETMAAKAQELQKYKTEYERMNDNNLKREYTRLKEKENWASIEEKNRLTAVKMVLKDRGYGN